MYRTIPLDPISPPCDLTVDVAQQRDELFAKVDEYNGVINGLADAATKLENLRTGLTILAELLAHLDAVDAEQASHVAEAQAAVDAAIAKANADLIKAGLATAETVYIYADKIGTAPAVCQARERLQQISEWTSRGTRQVIDETRNRLSHEFSTIERMPASRQPALV